MNAELSYDGLWVAISFAIAIGASTVALWLAAKGTRPPSTGCVSDSDGFRNRRHALLRHGRRALQPPGRHPTCPAG
ncbi:hypothetical protein PAA25_13570 [Stutzerimonas frequens]|nr:MHYT domain-containing protein [Stutzerimonas frequens]MDA0426289.1 hypothetical protein [Stutzerimonas frequens]